MGFVSGLQITQNVFVLVLFICLGLGLGFACLFANVNTPLEPHTVALSNFSSLALSHFSPVHPFLCS